MSDLRFTDTNAADDSAGRAFGLEGNLYLPVVVALVVAVALFGLVNFVLGMKWPIAVAAGTVPVVATIAWIVALKHGKPAGYDRDFVENVWGRGHMTRTVSDAPLGRSHDGAPDGRFVDDMLLFGSPEHGGVIVKGFWVAAADLRGASNERRNAFQDQARGLLALVTAGRRIQFYWFPAADHRRPLLGYHADTQPVEDPLIRGIRNERFSRYWPRMLRCELRRERLAVFVSIEIPTYAGNVRTHDGLHQHYGTLLRELSAQFDEFAGTLRTVFGADTPVTPMGDLDHFGCLQRFLNPSLASRGLDDPAALFDPSLTIQENCWHSEGVGQPDGGLFLDGHFHAVVTLDRWPRQTRPGIVTHLTGLPIHDYAITVNVRPATMRQEIHREERAAERLRGEYTEKPRPSLLVALRKKERKVEALSGGFSRPFHVTYVIRVWAPTKEALREKISTLQAAINAMDGAQYFECTLPTTAKKLFYATWPGWTHSSYHHRELYAEDTFLADMLPFSATFAGALNHAEALYDGSHSNPNDVEKASPQQRIRDSLRERRYDFKVL